jgi:hypothetical protein
MATKDVRPETVQVTEAAAWAQVQNLQETVFERFGLPSVVQLNDFLRHNYNALIAEGEKHGQGHRCIPIAVICRSAGSPIASRMRAST